MRKLFISKDKEFSVEEEIRDGNLGFLFVFNTFGNSRKTKRLEAHEVVKLIAALESRL